MTIYLDSFDTTTQMEFWHCDDSISLTDPLNEALARLEFGRMSNDINYLRYSTTTAGRGYCPMACFWSVDGIVHPHSSLPDLVASMMEEAILLVWMKGRSIGGTND